MGYYITLIKKFSTEEIKKKVFECFIENGQQLTSDGFSLFLSRHYEYLEYYQVQRLLEIDLSVYTKIPDESYYAEINKLEYELYLAEEENDIKKIKMLQSKIAEKNRVHHENYLTNHEGWTTVTEMTNLTELFVKKLIETPDFGHKIKTVEDWELDWGNYFNIRKGKEIGEETILDDLEILLTELKYLDKCGVEYVAFIGE